MTVVNWSAVFLGNIADMDTDKTTMTGEGAANLVGTYGSFATPISDMGITLTTNDGSSDTLTFETSPGAATATTTVDSIYKVNLNYFALGSGGGGGVSF